MIAGGFDGRAALRKASHLQVMAETMGFEPMIPLSGYAHLANECLQPLGHVSRLAPRRSMPDPRHSCKARSAVDGNASAPFFIFPRGQIGG